MPCHYPKGGDIGMKKIAFLLICLAMISCAYQKPIVIEIPLKNEIPGQIKKSPQGPSFYSDKFVLIALNGLSYRVRISCSGDEVEIDSGNQEEIFFVKSYQPRLVGLTGVVLSGEDEVIGTIAKRIRIPSGRLASAIEDIWHITSFRRLRR